MPSDGALICSHEGLVMLARTDIGVCSDGMNVAEAKALRFGLSLAKQVGLSLLIIKSDSLDVT